MNVSNWAIDRSTTVIVVLLLILVTGVFSYITLPRESEPEVIIPVAFVTVPYEGVAPEDMESLVSIPLERKLAGISGIKEMISLSTEGVATLIIHANRARFDRWADCHSGEIGALWPRSQQCPVLGRAHPMRPMTARPWCPYGGSE